MQRNPQNPSFCDHHDTRRAPAGWRGLPKDRLVCGEPCYARRKKRLGVRRSSAVPKAMDTRWAVMRLPTTQPVCCGCGRRRPPPAGYVFAVWRSVHCGCRAGSQPALARRRNRWRKHRGHRTGCRKGSRRSMAPGWPALPKPEAATSETGRALRTRPRPGLSCLVGAQPQCACSQFGPTPTSASSGTFSCATPAIRRGISPRSQSTSASGTSNTSSSCTCMIIFVPLP